MGRGTAELNAAAASYVCVKVTDMSRVDVRALRFDFDLTFAVVLMNADGTVYHRYGGRLPDAADGYLSMTSLATLLRDTLLDHVEYERSPSPPPAEEPLPAIELPWLQQRLREGAKIDCVHCHTVNDAQHKDAVRLGAYRPEQRWRFPDPDRIGLTLDREHQALVAEVAAGSAAANVGIEPGDELIALGVQRRVRTLSDVQWALHEAPFAAGRIPVRWRRGEAEREGALVLPDAWKVCPPEDYAWRPYKWNLSPSAGFGGPALDAGARRSLAIEDGTFAFRVQYIVDWGENAHRGRAAKAAGLRKGDVVVSFAGKGDFDSVDHFHAWVALTRTAGEPIEIVVLRDGERRVLRYELPR